MLLDKNGKEVKVGMLIKADRGVKTVGATTDHVAIVVEVDSSPVILASGKASKTKRLTNPATFAGFNIEVVE